MHLEESFRDDGFGGIQFCGHNVLIHDPCEECTCSKPGPVPAGESTKGAGNAGVIDKQYVYSPVDFVSRSANVVYNGADTIYFTDEGPNNHR